MRNIKEHIFNYQTSYFVILFVVFSFFYYNGRMSILPQNIHSWRQTDCISMTQKYAEGASFLEPEMNILLADDLTTGKSAGEFPLLYYIVGKTWSLFGQSYAIYRMFYLLILFLGLLSLFKTLRLLFKSSLVPLFVTLLFFTSPTFSFYGVNFLTDAPALSIALIGIYFFSLYVAKQRSWYIFVSMFLFAIAGLIKVSSLIPFCVIVGVYFIDFFVPLLNEKRLVDNRKEVGLSFLIVIVSIILWTLYASYYNAIHGFKYTFNAVFPIWTAGEDMQKSFLDIINTTSRLFYSRTVLYLLLTSSFLSVLLYRRMDKLSYSIVLLTLIGTLSYFILWAPLFGIHDYYFIPFMYLIIGVMIPFVFFLQREYTAWFSSNVLLAFSCVFLIFNFLYCSSLLNIRANKKPSLMTDLILGERHLIEYIEWSGYYSHVNEVVYAKARPFLSKLGIDKESKVICLPDPSFNVTLVMMDRDGWTNFKQYSKPEEIQNLIDHGAEFLLINDDSYLGKDFLKPFLNEKVGEFENVKIFKL